MTTTVNNTQSAEKSIEVHNPGTGEVLDTVPDCAPEQVQETLQTARVVFPRWRATPAIERAAVLLSFARAFRENVPELAELLAVEGGQPIRESEWEICWVADAFEYYAGLCRHYGGTVAPSNSTAGTNVVLKEPVGVIGAVIPWNYPLLLWAWKAAPAIAGGNCVVSKPSPETPLSVLRAHELLLEAGLPEGVHQVVTGGTATGEALVGSPLVDGIAFTGSLTAGKAVLRAAAENVTRICSLELSGHDPVIIWDDVDLDLAVEAAAFSAFVHGGQICTAGERFYVASTIYDTFVDKLCSYAKSLTIGSPVDPATEIGPQMNAGQIRRVEEYVASAVARGAQIRTGGRRATEHGDLYFEPTVLTGLSHKDMTELGEVFGPIAPIVPVDDFQTAVDLANDSPLGLGVSVLTSSLANAMLASSDLRFGSVWVNNPLLDNNGGPFGGFRQSGYGRELGAEGYEAFLETKHVTLEHELRAQSFWFKQGSASV